jgi:hypothetical protein
MIGVNDAAVNRTNLYALRLIVKSLALGAFIGNNVEIL